MGMNRYLRVVFADATCDTSYSQWNAEGMATRLSHGAVLFHVKHHRSPPSASDSGAPQSGRHKRSTSRLGK